MNHRSLVTEKRLRDALQRLINGKPERTRADNKINLSRINEEAGCSHGLIYKYPEVVMDARVAIQEHKTTKIRKGIIDSQLIDIDKIAKIKEERNKQEKLKLDYRMQRDNYQMLADDVVKRENELLFRCHELQITLNKINELRVVQIHDNS